TLALTGATPHAVAFSPELWWRELPAVLRAHDEPVHSATASVGYEIYRTAAREGVRVVLVGQGADEVLGGYPSYFDDQWYALLRERKWGEFLRQLGDFSAGHHRSRGRAVAMAMLRSVLITADQFAFYRALRATSRRTRAFPHQALLSPDLAALLPASHPPVANGLRAALQQGTERSPLPLYLRIEDRNSMAHSVEARVPFMDYRLVSLAFRLSGHWKIRGRWNKYLLREATRGLVPEVVRSRVEKMGFPTQMREWMRHELQEPIRELFGSPRFRQRGVFAPGPAERLLALHAAGGVDGGRALFNLAQTEIWLASLGARHSS
ncbi:MAG: asparagine synthase C-terminal domain-containing protein, partial [Gemmatimonadales bacterium]|nr:asparagine synthase C-terminal domain-containing protein [Gemmatimonadales bacterium]